MTSIRPFLRRLIKQAGSRRVPARSLLLLLMMAFSLHAGARRSLPIQIVNHSRFPVHATAVPFDEAEIARGLGMEPTAPWRLTGPDLKTSRATRDGKPFTFAHISLSAQSRIELAAAAAPNWKTHSVATASLDLKPIADARPAPYSDGVREIHGTLSNGVVRVDLDRAGWKLSFAAPDATLVHNGVLDLWVDNQDRGRIANADPKQLGLSRLPGSTIVSATSDVTDGVPRVTLIRKMGGIAEGMRVVETYELPAGQPILICRVQWQNTTGKPLWVAYVGSGDGIRGSWHKSLMPRPLIERKKSPLLGDLDGGETRCAWLGQLCRISMESHATGCGVGMSTLLATPGKIGQGSMIWGCGASGFQCNFIDPVQGQFPFKVQPGGTLDNGFAFLAAQAATSVFRDTQEVWRTVQAGKSPTLSSPVAVYVAGQPLIAQTLTEMSGPIALLPQSEATRSAAIRLDFNRHYELQIDSSAPVEITAKPFDRKLKPVVLNAAGGKQSLQLNESLAWKDDVPFSVSIQSGVADALRSLRLVETLPVSPEPLSPLPGASFTDIATMFRWRAIPLVVDYELQYSASSDFANPVSSRVATSDPFPWYLPPENQLPAAGDYHWRVRGIKGDVLGQWSQVRTFRVNIDRSTRPVERPLTAENPLFTIEASKVTDFTNFTPDFPADLAAWIGIIAEGYVDKGLTIDRFVKGLEKLPYSIMIRSHPPTWVNLPDLEWVCQNLPNFVGIQGGETLSNLYAEARGNKSPGDADYHRRMTMICAKYGKIYHEADGTYRDDKWQDLFDKQPDFLRRYGHWLVLSQKNNIIRRQFYSQSAAMGLWLGNITHQHGAWEDGGFYWQNAGFSDLGQCAGERKGTLKTMPRNFWSLVMVMGISRGCAIYSLDGQTLMYSPKELERWPDEVPRAVIWDTTGRTTTTFNRHVVPLMRAITGHGLIPTRQQVLSNIHLAVFNDIKGKGDLAAWPHYMEYGPLYAGTYGFQRMSSIDGQLWELFPNTGRFYYIPALVQGDQPLAPAIRNIPLSRLQKTEDVKRLFEAAYPKWYDGDALACVVGNTITVQNTHENVDITQTFSIPLNRGTFQLVAGNVAPHAYLVGGLEDNNRRLWLSSNGEYSDRPVQLAIKCQSKPQWHVEPAAALTAMNWDATAMTLTLGYTHAHGAVEISVR